MVSWETASGPSSHSRLQGPHCHELHHQSHVSGSTTRCACPSTSVDAKRQTALRPPRRNSKGSTRSSRGGRPQTSRPACRTLHDSGQGEYADIVASGAGTEQSKRVRIRGLGCADGHDAAVDHQRGAEVEPPPRGASCASSSTIASPSTARDSAGAPRRCRASLSPSCSSLPTEVPTSTSSCSSDSKALGLRMNDDLAT